MQKKKKKTLTIFFFVVVEWLNIFSWKALETFITAQRTLLLAKNPT